MRIKVRIYSISFSNRISTHYTLWNTQTEMTIYCCKEIYVKICGIKFFLFLLQNPIKTCQNLFILWKSYQADWAVFECLFLMQICSLWLDMHSQNVKWSASWDAFSWRCQNWLIHHSYSSNTEAFSDLPYP